MSTFLKLSADRFDAEDASIKTLNANEYKNLPKASESEAGIIKIDIESFTIENGVLKIKLNKNVEEHINNKDLHKSTSDIEMMNSIEKHVKNLKLHFDSDEKENIKKSVLKINEIESKVENLEKQDVKIDNAFIELVKEHIENGSIHIMVSDIETIKADLENKLSLTDNKVNGVLGINNVGSVVTSSVNIEYIEKMLTGLDDNIVELLSCKSKDGHQHNDAYAPLNHSTNDTIHVTSEWKKEIENKIKTLEEENDELKKRINDLENKETLKELSGEFNG